MKAVILAGGKGTRLAPYTTIFPKPLMPLGEKPILEIIIKQLKSHNFKEVTLAVGYLAELIKAYFSDGSDLGIKINYSKEDVPLGTAGPLSLIEGLNETFLVMNGDVLTSLSYSNLIDYHKDRGGVATIAISRRIALVDFGVIKFEPDSGVIKDYTEKPTLKYDVSMGIYVFEPEVLRYIPKGHKLDFPDLIKILLGHGEKVIGYLSEDKWLDIGRHDDYAIAQDEYNAMKDHLFSSKTII